MEDIGSAFEKRMETEPCFKIAYINTESRTLIADVESLIDQGSSPMFSSKIQYVIHDVDTKCGDNSEDDAEAEQTVESEILDSMEGYNWAKRGATLYKYMKPHLSNSPVVQGVWVIDLIKYCVNSDNLKAGKPKGVGDKKIEKVLREMKRMGLRIPQTYLVNSTVKKMFA